MSAPRRAKLWVMIALVYAVFAVLVWFLGSWLALSGGSIWLLRIGLWLLGLGAVGLVVWFFAGGDAQGESAGRAGGGELDTTLAAAAARLAGAGGAAAPGLRGLPVIVVLGPAGSAKTSVVVHSGLGADLLAGEGFQGDRIGPTPGINLWYTQRSVLLEAGGKLVADPGSWTRLIRRVRPRRLRATVTGRAQASRAALVCFSCEQLLKPDVAQGVAASGHELRALLGRLSQGFGVALPVYVLFTKADRVPYFAEFVEQLSREEADQVLGTTLPWPGRMTAGVYADREFQRLTAAYDRLLGALASKRLDLLAREGPGDRERRAGAYEFPRELRKTVPATIQFLVELCRPSQLELGPVLRGFYYTGVRAVVAGDAAVPGPAAVGPARVAAATQVFDAAVQQAAARLQPSPAAGAARRTPQWLFLRSLYRDVLLQDRAPAAVAQGARSVALLRRIAFAGVTAASLIGGLWSMVQYVRNGRAVAAARALALVGPSVAELPTAETLDRLETVREHLGRLSRAWRWWWYKGTGLYPELLQIYKTRFDRILLDPAQVALVRSLDSLPAVAKASDQYGHAYDRLKAYLMTTNNPDQLAAGFVVPILMDQWRNGRQVDSTRTDLARRQFDFYATRLCRTAACGADAEARTVERTRGFLGQFTGVERSYQLIISEANAKNPGIAFQRRFPSAAGVLGDAYEIPGAFTDRGWESVQRALRHVDRQTDDWVLGAQQGAPVDRAKLVGDLDSMYVAEYLRHWRAFLAAASVLPYGSPKDAARKLAQLGGNQSPVLALLGLVAQHAKVDAKRVGVVFQPVSVVVSTGAAPTDATKPYLVALNGLQVVVDQMATAGPTLMPQALDAARGATSTVGQLAQKFAATDDAADVGARVSHLLQEPIARVEQLTAHLPVAALNGRGTAFCSAFASVLAKYPFRPEARVDATVAEVAGLIDPSSGALLRFYNEALPDVLIRQGGQYVPKPGAAVAVTPAFVRFFNHLAGVADVLWPAGSKEPGFDFTIKLLASEAIPTATFSMDGQVHTFSRTSMGAEPYRWSALTARDVRVLGTSRGRDETLLGEDGTWAFFKLLQRATWQGSGATTVVRWPVTLGGQAAQLWAELNLGVARPLLKGDYFAGSGCVSQIVQ